jgi:hypothetical protein
VVEVSSIMMNVLVIFTSELTPIKILLICFQIEFSELI